MPPPLDLVLAATEVAQRAFQADAGFEGVKLGACLTAKEDRAVFEAKADKTALILKVHMGDGASEAVEAQTAELSQQGARMDKGRYRVPRLVHASDTEPVVLMERAPGIRADKAVGHDHIPRDALLSGAGRWLADYVKDRRMRDRFGGGFWIKKRHDALAEVQAPEDKTRLIGLINFMAAERFAIKSLDITRARSHGDFVPINLMVDGDTFWGVDIQNSRHLALAKDVARFLVYLEMSDPAPSGPWNWGLATADVAAMLGDGDLLPVDEADAVLPYFIAAELSGRFLPDAHNKRHLKNIRAATDRLLSQW